MEDFATIFMTLAASLVSTLAMIFIRKINARRNKIMEVKDAEGRTEEVIVPASSSPAEIQKIVLDAKNFENHVGEVLKRVIATSEKKISLVSKNIDNIDFIIPELMVGFEVKNRISESAVNQARSLVHEGGLKHVYLIIKDNPEKMPRRILQNLVDSGKITVMSGEDDDVLSRQLLLAMNIK